MTKAPYTKQLSQEQMNQVNAAADIIQTGGVVVFPTETVYGLGADATNTQSVRKIYEIKQRPSDHPLILHIAETERLDYWSQDIPESAWKLARIFWPGPLTLILKRSRHVPDCVTGGQDTVGIRIPAHPMALALLNAIKPDKAIAAPSANLYGKISPTTAQHVQTALGSKVGMILDGGPCEVGLESTIVSFDQDSITVLRPGGILLSEIEAALGRPVSLAQNAKPAVRVSGALPSHYAPATPLKLHSKEEISQLALQFAEQHYRTAVITWSQIDPLLLNTPNIQHSAMPSDPIQYSKLLYAVLHQYDQAGFDYILMETPPQKPAWLAISDRLCRASHAHMTT